MNQTGIKIYPKDREIKTTTKIKHDRPEIVVMIKGERKQQLINIPIPQDHNIVIKENEKVNECKELTGAIRTEQKVKTETVTLVIGALGSVSKQIKISVDVIDAPNIIGSACNLSCLYQLQYILVT